MKLFSIKFLGGAKRIGQNSTLLQFKDEDLLIDAGLNFPEDKTLGVQYRIPDFKKILNTSRVKKIVITHAHEDHIGALTHLLKLIPGIEIYCSPLAQAFIEKKLSYEPSIKNVKFLPFEKIFIDQFSIYPFGVNHSIPETTGIFIESEESITLFISDFKIDNNQPYEKPLNLEILEKFKSKKIRYLLPGSTAIFVHEKTPSESDLLPGIESICASSHRRIFVTLFSSHLHRIESFIRSAKKNNRNIYFAGKSLLENTKIGRKFGMISEGNYADLREFPINPNEKALIFCAGCQGDQRSALSQIVYEKNKVRIEPTDLFVFSSRPIPGTGNDRYINRLYDMITDKGGSIITSEDKLIHASGHPSQKDLSMIINAFRPTHLTPVHGDTFYLKRHELFIKENFPEIYCIIVQNFTTIHLDDSGQITKEQDNIVPFLSINDGKMVLEQEVLKERSKIAERGLIILHPKNQEIKITMIGIPKELKHHFKKPLYIENFDLHAFKKRAEQILRTKVEILSLL